MKQADYLKRVPRVGDLTEEQRRVIRSAPDHRPEAEVSVAAVDQGVGEDRWCPRCDAPGTIANGRIPGTAPLPLQGLRAHLQRGGRHSSVRGLHHKELWLGFGRSPAAGEAVKAVAERCGISPETTLHWCHWFLNVIKNAPEKLRRIIEAGEAFLLENRKGSRDLGCLPWYRGGRASKRDRSPERVPILVAAGRSGTTVGQVPPNISAEVLSASLEPVHGLGEKVSARSSLAATDLSEKLSEEQPWSTFRPHGWARRLAMSLVALGRGRGSMQQRIRRLWFRGGTGTVADVTRNGLRWRLDFSDNRSDGHLLFSSREHNRDEIRVLARACSTGVFVDIGANIGYYTVRLASTGARVLALEPNPIAYHRMLVNIGLNDLASRVVALPIGVGETGEATLSFGNDNLGEGSTVASERAANTITIRTSPLADILASQGIREVTALKIDIEGAEDRALVPFFRSASRDMWPRCIVIEDHHRGRWETDIINLLLDEGYRMSMRTRMNFVLSR